MYGYFIPPQKLIKYVCPSCKHVQEAYEGTAGDCSRCLDKHETAIEMITMYEFARRAAASGPSDKIRKNYWEPE